MKPLTIALVRTGRRYGPEYVARLQSGIMRHLPGPLRFICITDQDEKFPGIENVHRHELDELPGWWAKMLLFDPEVRGGGDALYLDLDTVVAGDLSTLGAWRPQFSICGNFTRLRGNDDWPCRYGSCAMFFPEGWGTHVWEAFWDDRAGIMAECGKYGDQLAIEKLAPQAGIFQNGLRPGFFLHYRDLPKFAAKPASASLIVFGGSHKPDNCESAWVRREWEQCT